MKATFIRVYCILGLIVFPFILLAQKNVAGYYRGHPGHLELNSDSTFKYTFQAHGYSAWSKGVWSLKNDTVLLTTVPIYDTISETQMDINFRIPVTMEQLVLSYDEIPGRYSKSDFESLTNQNTRQLLYRAPNKLLARKQRLYVVLGGKVFKQKIKASRLKKKQPSWYSKIKY